MWVRGLKQGYGKTSVITTESHPMWVRGLKPLPILLVVMAIMSHPMWVRGLKLYSLRCMCDFLCRILCGCVD